MGSQVPLQVAADEVAPVSGPLVGKTFVITGTLPNLSREDATERIEEAGLSDGDEVQVGKFRLMFLAGRRSHADRGGGAQVGA